MPLITNPFEVRNFTGGLTDHQNTEAPNTYLALDNLLFNADGELFTRYGSVVYNAAQLPSGTQRVSKIVNYNNDGALITLSNARAFYDNAGTWTEILSPAGTQAIPGASASSNYQTDEWKRHLFISSDSQIQPVKIIKDDTQGWLSITAGLPKMATPISYNSANALADAIALANALRTALLAHFPSTRHQASDTVSAGLLTAAAATTLPTLITLVNQMLLAYVNHFNDYQGASKYHSPETFTEQTDAGDQTLVSIIPVIDLPGAVAILNDLRPKYSAHMGKVDIHKGEGNAPGESLVGVTGGNLVFGVYNGPYAEIDMGFLCQFANNIKSTFLASLNDYYPGSGTTTNYAHKALDPGGATISGQANATDSASLETLLAFLWEYYSAHEFDASLVTPSYHIAKENLTHTTTPNPGAWVSDTAYGTWSGAWTKMVTRLLNLQSQLTAHMSDVHAGSAGAHYNGAHYILGPGAGIWYIDYAISNPMKTSANDILGSYKYAFTYTYTYVVNGVTFLMESEPLLFGAENVVSTSIQGLTINGLVPLDNNSGLTNYDLAKVKINIYRTTNNGTSLFLVATVPGAASQTGWSSSYTDTLTDSELVSRQELYTDGGVNPNSLPPQAKFMMICNDAGYWANFPGNSNRIVQSQPGIPDGVWGGNFVDLPYDVQGISNFRGIPIAWTASQTYRLEGQFDNLGNGQISATPIATNIGLLGSFSPIAYDNGVVFAAQDGFYLTDGYRVQKINTYWRDTYLNLVRSGSIASQIHGVYERNQRRLWWVTNTDSADNDSCYVLDANFPLADNSVFSSLNAKAQSANFAPSSIGYFKGQIIRGDTHGYVFKHDPAYRSDPKVDTGAAVNTWTTAWITYSYQSPYFDFGSLMFRKWNPRVNVKCRNNGNLSLQINLFTDNSTTEKSALSPLYYRGGSDVIEQRGHVPAGYLRCRNRSIQLTNAFVIIQNSDTFGQATLDRVAKTLTLGASWTGDLVDQVVAFPGDAYTTGFTITAQAGAVLTLSDPGGLLPASGLTKWEVKGYPKDELFQMTSYNLHVAMLGKNQPVMGTSTGANT